MSRRSRRNASYRSGQNYRESINRYNSRGNDASSRFGRPDTSVWDWEHTFNYGNYRYDRADAKDVNDVATEIFGGTYYRHDSAKV